jgi:alpha-beta hydrolase superfamily lysophospholipase
VLAGLPGHGALAGGDWDAELEVRSHCPTHRGVLIADTSLRHGALAQAVSDELLDAAYADVADIPQLLLVGDSDPLADRPALERTAKALPIGRLTVVRGAHHDVLNDLQHRSVAAEVVTFLETLRNDLTPLLAVETSTW